MDWLNKNQPDVLALQETKTQDPNFPAAEFENLGWQVAFSGQKTFNGVAIIAKQPIEVKTVELPDYPDSSKRILGAEIGNTFILDLYVPNGQAVESEKYHYKLAWLDALHAYTTSLLSQYEHLILLGDFNIAPADIDVHDPIAWDGHVLVSPKERTAWRRLLELGLTDSFRHLNQEAETNSWWDYRQGAFRRNRGLRIDHILISGDLTDKLVECWIDKAPRRLERPSDHAPVVAEFDI